MMPYIIALAQFCLFLFLIAVAVVCLLMVAAILAGLGELLMGWLFRGKWRAKS